MRPPTNDHRPARARPRARRRAAAPPPPLPPLPPPLPDELPTAGLELFEPEGGAPNPLDGATLGSASRLPALELFPPEVAADHSPGTTVGPRLHPDTREWFAVVEGEIRVEIEGLRGLPPADDSGDADARRPPSVVDDLPLAGGRSELAPANSAQSSVALSAGGAITTTTSAWQRHTRAVSAAGAAALVLVLVATAWLSRSPQETLGARGTVIDVSELRPTAVAETPTPLHSTEPAADVATTVAAAAAAAVVPATAPPPRSAAPDRSPATAPPPVPQQSRTSPDPPAPTMTASPSAPLVPMASPAVQATPVVEASAAVVPEAPAPPPAPAAPPPQRDAVELAAPTITPLARSDAAAAEAPAVAAPPNRPASPAAEPASDTARLARDMAAIQSVLARYGEAFSGLDIGGVSQVWPSVDADALGRAFRGVEEQVLSFDACNIDVGGNSAGASCRGTVRYVPRIGSRNARTERRVWQFALRNAGDHWVIERVNSR